MERQRVRTVSQLSDLKEIVEELKKLLGPKGILLLNGDVGVGKTKTVEYLLRSCGCDKVSSPTFALHQVYTTQLGTVDHFDFYRVKTLEEIESCGLWDLMGRAEGWIIIEWPQLLQPRDFPSNWQQIWVTITLQGEQRIFKIDSSRPKRPSTD